MGDTGGVDRVDGLELDLLGDAWVEVEEADAAAEEDRDQVDFDFVEEAGFDELLDRLAAGDGNVLVARRRAGLLEGALDAVLDEGEGRPSLLDERIAGAVGKDEDRLVEGRFVSPGPSPWSNMRRPMTIAPVASTKAAKRSSTGPVSPPS
jgi:hypothetical protein